MGRSIKFNNSYLNENPTFLLNDYLLYEQLKKCFYKIDNKNKNGLNNLIFNELLVNAKILKPNSFININK